MQPSKYGNFPPLAGILISFVVMGFLANCSPPMQTYRLYQGPQLPSAETAQLLCKGDRIQLNAVNGMKSPDGKDTFGPVTLEILPGDYHLTLSFSGRSMTLASGGLYYYNIFYRHDSLNDVDITMAAEAGRIYLVTSTHDYQKSSWHVVVRDETGARIILKKGPYPLNKIRTGDNQDVRRVYRQ